MTQSKKRKFMLLAVILGALLLVALGTVLFNRVSAEYRSLNDADQQLLREFSQYCEQTQRADIWNGFNLSHRTVLAIGGLFQPSYLINPSAEVRSPFAVKLKMPEDIPLEVYRLSWLTPQVMKWKLSIGNFNEIGQTYRLWGNELYYMRYDAKTSLQTQGTSRHFIAFLAHEAFHYYMQNNWPAGGRFMENLSKTDIDWMEKQYSILAQVQKELAGESGSQESLRALAREYIDVMEQRLQANPAYLQAELSMETAEGTASYAAIQAARAVGYDLGVMYFDNQKNVSFTEVIPMLRAGKIDASFLADHTPYETGAQLCLWLDAMGVPDWQQALNKQTLDAPVTLYDILKGFVEENGTPGA